MTSALTALAYLIRAGIPEPRAREHLDEGRVWIGGVLVTDPDAPATGHPVLRLTAADFEAAIALAAAATPAPVARRAEAAGPSLFR